MGCEHGWLCSGLLPRRAGFESLVPHVRKVTRDVTVSEPITLDDLRWLVDQCKDFPPGSRVSVTGYKYIDPRDHDSASITVHGAESR